MKTGFSCGDLEPIMQWIFLELLMGILFVVGFL